MAKNKQIKGFSILVTQEELHFLMSLVTSEYVNPVARNLARSIALQVGRQGGSSYKGGYIGVIEIRKIV